MSGNDLTKHDHILFGLVSQYQTLAMVSLGKIQNPISQEIERDLDQARAFIDILEMLKVKCRTGTPAELLRILDSAVMDLQLNYMEERKLDSRQATDRAPDQTEGQPPAEDAGPTGPEAGGQGSP